MNRMNGVIIAGDSDDSYSFVKMQVGGVLNVSHDLCGFKECNYPEIEYMQVGLIDGPGNEVIGYCSAILSLVVLARRHKLVGVYNHGGGMAFAVSAMYLNLVSGKFRADSTKWSHWMTWNERIKEIGEIPTFDIHTVHIEAFSKIPYGLMEAFL